MVEEAVIPGRQDDVSELPRQRVLRALSSSVQLTASEVSSLSSRQLLALADALGTVRREVDLMLAVVANAQAEQSAARAGGDGLARQQGHGSARGLVSRQTGGTHHEAERLLQVGAALADAERRDAGAQAGEGDGAGAPDGAAGEGVAGEGDSGHNGPGALADVTPVPEPDAPHFPHVTAAVREAALSIDAANAITRMLKAVHGKCPEEAWERAERALVEKARHTTYEQLTRVVRRYRDSLDRAGIEARAQEQRDKRYFVMNEDSDGMLVINGKLDPENAAPLKAAVDAMVAHGFRLRRREAENAGPGNPVSPDRRSAGQMRADALGTFARHLLKCDADDLPLAGTRVVIRTTLEDLRTDGPAFIDGAAAAIPAGEARRMAAEAGIIPMVLGGASQVLDLGREARLFTKAQKLALIERDGGCAKCGAPPSWCDAHHIRSWADGGATDLTNGVMLCVRCHHDVHRQHWGIRATEIEVWFTPPASIDPQRRPCPGGRMLYGGPEAGVEVVAGNSPPRDPSNPARKPSEPARKPSDPAHDSRVLSRGKNVGSPDQSVPCAIEEPDMAVSSDEPSLRHHDSGSSMRARQFRFVTTHERACPSTAGGTGQCELTPRRTRRSRGVTRHSVVERTLMRAGPWHESSEDSGVST